VTLEEAAWRLKVKVTQEAKAAGKSLAETATKFIQESAKLVVKQVVPDQERLHHRMWLNDADFAAALKVYEACQDAEQLPSLLVSKASAIDKMSTAGIGQETFDANAKHVADIDAEIDGYEQQYASVKDWKTREWPALKPTHLTEAQIEATKGTTTATIISYAPAFIAEINSAIV
jgi:hypothetical protein